MDADRDNAWVRRRGDDDVAGWRDYHPPTGRDRLRHLALEVVSATGRLTGSTDRALRVPGVQFLLLHHLLEDEVDRFRTLITALARTHDFLGYGAAVTALRNGTVARPSIVFSFDDGRASCLPAGRILAEHGARACFFVCPEIVGETRRDRLRSFCHDRLHYPVTPFLNWDELESLQAMGHEIGNHTFGHMNLGPAEPTALGDQIDHAAEVIRARLGACDHFAWPYGGVVNITPEAVASVFDTGHRSIASALRGRHHGVIAEHACLRRDHVIAEWPVRHTLHFIAANVRRNRHADGWPPGWAARIEERCASRS